MDIDVDNDDIYEWLMCPSCCREVKPKIVNGLPAMKELTPEDLYWESLRDWDDNDHTCWDYDDWDMLEDR